jgi:5-methyltetrahydropteroyltriglutamate--homocysteine methyltransferase
MTVIESSARPGTPTLDRLRADNLGSLLRPEALRRAFERHDAHGIGDNELRHATDEAIREVVAAQERCGLPILTDGEFRRRHFNESFAEVTGFVDAGGAPVLMSQPGGPAAPTGPSGETMVTQRRRVVAPLGLARNAPLEEFLFTQALTERPVKATLVNPDGAVQRYDDSGSSLDVYPTIDDFLRDVIAVGREIVGGLVDAGCRYVQVDAPRYGAYFDSSWAADMKASGRDPQERLARAVEAENALIAGFPGVTFGLHLCRGNRRSQWHYNGGYDAVAEQLFATAAHQRLLLEYDSDRSGSFEPLRFVGDDTVVVLGLITTKSGELEDADEVIRRIEEASRYVPADRLALSTQCGFASVMTGNILSEDDQWRKLELVLSIAERVWGSDTPTGAQS